MNDQKSVIEVKNLGHYFGQIKAVDDITFNVKKGEVLGFLGPNGAGKSTTMRMLSCFISPTFGSAKIDDVDIIANPYLVRQKIGYLPENAPSYEDMNVESFLDFVASVRGLSGKDKEDKLKKVFSVIDIEKVRYQKIETLSKGYKRRVSFAQAIVHEPEILILDEPTDGLDPNQKHEIRNLIREMSKDKVIILSTHILEEVEEVCTRVIIIANGKLKADGTPQELKQQSDRSGVVELTLSADFVESAYNYFKILKNIEKIEKTNSVCADQDIVRLDIFPKEDESLVEAIIDECRKNNWQIKDISVNKGNLAEVFRKITIEE